MKVFFLGLAPAYKVYAFVSGGGFEVMGNSEVCSDMVPGDNGQKHLKSNHNILQRMASRTRRKEYLN